jgi:hypothetical protein
MKTKILLLVLLSTLNLPPATGFGQTNPPYVVDIITLHTNNGVVTKGDALPTAFGKVNSNAVWFQLQLAAGLTNGSGSGVTNLVPTNGVSIIIGSTLFLNTNYASGSYLLESFGAGNDLTISNTFTLMTNSIVGWNLTTITISGPTNCDGSTNSIYNLCQDTNSIVFGYLTNSCTNIYTPIQFTNFPPGLSNIVTDPTVSNFVNNAGVTNQMTALYLNQLVKELNDNGLLTNLYAVYPFAVGTPAGDSVNLISNNANYSIAWNGFMASAAAHGIWGVSNNANGIVSSYGDTGFKPSVISPSLLNNLSLAVWIGQSHNDAYHTPYIMGALDSSAAGGSFLQAMSSTPAVTNDLFFIFANNPQSGSMPIQQTLTKSGFIGASRTTNTSYTILTEQNGPNTYNQTSTVVANGNMFIGAVNYPGFGTISSISSLGFVAFGNGISDSKLSTLKNIVDNYNAWRPASTFQQYYAIPTQAPTANINYGGATNIFALWRPYTTNSWILTGTAPSCGFGGPCFPGPVIMCAPSHQWYVLSSYYTNSPTGSNVCIYCQTH